MNITFRQLEVFEVVARLLSYTKAAKQLHLSQPAVSMQIKQLEENTGLPLFEQLGRKIYLTEAGREMYHYCKTIAQQLDEAQEVLEQLKGLKSGRLKISVATTANAFVTHMLSKFNKRYEGATVSLDVTNREQLLKQLADNDKDIVIMGRPPDDADLITEVFADNPLVVIAAPDHPITRSSTQPIPLSMLQDQTFVVREQGSGTRTAMQRFFDGHNLSITSSMEMNENESIKQAVQAGMGLGVVSIHTIELELETKRLVILNVEDFPIMRHWYLVHRKEKRLSPITQRFKEFVLSEGRKFISHV